METCTDHHIKALTKKNAYKSVQASVQLPCTDVGFGLEVLKEMVLWCGKGLGFDCLLNWLLAALNITGSQTDARTMTSHLLEVNLKPIKEHRSGDARPAPKLSGQPL